MGDQIRTDICVIGAGAAGLVVAAGASQFGASVVLIEKGKMGGDCLNYGCVPSKALLAAGRMAAIGARGSVLGIHHAEPKIDFAAVHDHVAGVIEAIAPMDSQARFEALGVHVIRDEARFTGPDRVEVSGQTVIARRFVIATGTRPAVPVIPGLDQVPYLTNETLFDLEAAPGHLIILGGGPVGIEMAQAHHHLGCRVTVLEMDEPLMNEDPEMVALLVATLRREGIDLRTQTNVTAVGGSAGAIAVTTESDGTSETISGTHLLVAAGRAPVLEALNLDAAGVRTTARGVTVDARHRTSNRKIYAIGDVAGGPQFTHLAGYQAGIVLRNILFRLPAKAKTNALPRVIYTEPELAHVGLTEREARSDAALKIEILRWPLSENDRATAERNPDGLVKVIVTARGKILGASILGPGAGDLILPWTLAISNGLKIGAMAAVIAPYPTRSEASKRAAGNYYMPRLFTARTKALVRFLARFG